MGPRLSAAPRGCGLKTRKPALTNSPATSSKSSAPRPREGNMTIRGPRPSAAISMRTSSSKAISHSGSARTGLADPIDTATSAATAWRFQQCLLPRCEITSLIEFRRHFQAVALGLVVVDPERCLVLRQAVGDLLHRSQRLLLAEIVDGHTAIFPIALEVN